MFELFSQKSRKGLKSEMASGEPSKNTESETAFNQFYTEVINEKLSFFNYTITCSPCNTQTTRFIV